MATELYVWCLILSTKITQTTLPLFTNRYSRALAKNKLFKVCCYKLSFA